MKGFIYSKKGTVLIFLLAFVVAFAVTFMVISKKAQPKVTTESLMTKIEESSELTTVKMICTGLSKFSNEKVRFVNRNEYHLVYKATVKAGFDLDALKIDVTDSQVNIKVPKIKIVDINLDENSIKTYDKNFALFKMDREEDLIEAQKQIKSEIQKKTEMKELKDMAKKSTKTLLEGLFKDTIGDRQLKIEFTK